MPCSIIEGIHCWLHDPRRQEGGNLQDGEMGDEGMGAATTTHIPLREKTRY